MILVAPTAYKGTISAAAAARALARGLEGLDEVVTRPLADGGNGLIDALSVRGGELRTVEVSGPLGQAVQARLLLQDDLVVAESADACGLHLVAPDQRNPLLTTTFGVGELLLAAAALEQVVVIGLGGSATIDGGLGCAHALGWRFLDGAGNTLAPVPASLSRIEALIPAEPLNAPVIALADVTTRLAEAPRVFGPQKGADAAQIEMLSAGLSHLGRLIERTLGVEVSSLSGGGAAGGLGAALVACAGAELVRGSAWVSQRLELESLLARADLVITGEGSYDEQSALGKITGHLIERAALHGCPVVLVAGRVEGVPAAHVTVATQDAPLDESALARLAQEAYFSLQRERDER